MNASAARAPRTVDATVLLAGARRHDRLLGALSAAGLEFALAGSLQLLARSQSASAAPVLVIAAASADAKLLRTLAGARRLSPARLVVVCDSIDDRAVRVAITAGAAAVILAREVATALGPCVHAVRAGLLCVPQRAAAQLMRPTLSAREKQVLALVVMGYMNVEIAERLFLAQSTVKSHLSSAFAKLGVRSRHEAADLILDPRGGLSTGILALGADPVPGAAPPRADVPA